MRVNFKCQLIFTELTYGCWMDTLTFVKDLIE